MNAPHLSNNRWVHFDPERVYNPNRVQIVLSLSHLRKDLDGYLKALEPYGYDLQHLVGFAVYTLGERQQLLAGPGVGQMVYLQPNADSYLAHELLTVNPYIGRDHHEYQRVVGTARDAIGVIIQVIRGQILNATRNPNTSRVLLERYLGPNAVILSVEVHEAPHGTTVSPTAPVL